MMSKALIILRHEFLQTLKKKSFLLTTLALPLLAFLALGIYQLVESRTAPALPEEMNMGYVDATGLLDDHQEQGLVLFIPYETESQARTALLQGDIDEYFVIPDNYIETGLIIRYAEEAGPRTSPAIVQMVDFLRLNLASGDLEPAIMERVNRPAILESYHLDEQGEVVPARDEIADMLLPFILAMVFYFALFFSAGFLFQSVTEEKENRILEVLVSSVNTRQLLAGKILGLGAAGLLQVAVWLVSLFLLTRAAAMSIPALEGITLPASLLAWAVVYFVLGYILFAGLYTTVGSITPTAREAQSLSTIFVLPVAVPLFVWVYIMENPAAALTRALTLFPLTSPMTAMMRLPGETMHVWEIALSLIILLFSVGLILWSAAKIFRIYMLMYGKRPAFREIIRNVRSE